MSDSPEDVALRLRQAAAEIREAKVYETLGEMVVRRDDLLTKFAVVMHGEIVVVGFNRGPIVRPAVNVRIVDRSRSFDMI